MNTKTQDIIYKNPCTRECKNRAAGCKTRCFKYFYYLDHKPKTKTNLKPFPCEQRHSCEVQKRENAKKKRVSNEYKTSILHESNGINRIV